MTLWFRMYNEALDDPKVQQLSPEMFKGWVNMLCLATRLNGVIPESTVAFSLRIAHAKAASLIEGLIGAGLFERTESGLIPHNWNGRQHKSDVSNERVARYRERQRNVTQTVTETPPETESETESETEEKDAAEAAPPYGFDGKIIKLKTHDLMRWRESYKNLDVIAELANRDDWLATAAPLDARKNWFISTSNWLNTRNRAAAKPRASPVTPLGVGG